MSSIQVVERALDILKLISESGRDMGVSEISRITGLHKSTVYRTLYTMNKKNYLYQNKETKEYSLGNEALLIGFKASSSIPIVKIAGPYMAFLSEKYNESIVLDLFHEGHTVAINYYRGNYSTSFYSLDDQTRVKNPYRPAIIYAMLAYQSNLKDNDPFILGYRGGRETRGPKSIDELIEKLRKVREKGYAFEDGEFRYDEICYAVPIFDPPAAQGRAIATISIAGNEKNLNEFPKEELVKDLKNVASYITDLWGPISKGYVEGIGEELETSK